MYKDFLQEYWSVDYSKLWLVKFWGRKVSLYFDRKPRSPTTPWFRGDIPPAPTAMSSPSFADSAPDVASSSSPPLIGDKTSVRRRRLARRYMKERWGLRFVLSRASQPAPAATNESHQYSRRKRSKRQKWFRAKTPTRQDVEKPQELDPEEGERILSLARWVLFRQPQIHIRDCTQMYSKKSCKRI